MNKPSPPSFAQRFFQWYCKPSLQESILGDLEEQFEEDVEAFGARKARRRFAWTTLRFFRKGIIRPVYDGQKLNYYGMISIYLTSGWRNFRKHQTFSFINVFGLTVGFAAAILLFLIVRYERSFDQFHTKYDNIYKVGNLFPNGEVSEAIVTPQVPLMEKEYAEILRSTRFLGSDALFSFKDYAITSDYHLVDPGFADMFDFTVIKGDLRRTLSNPDEMAITTMMAKKLFGDRDPIGETVSMIGEDKSFIVTTLLSYPPNNSSLQFECLIAWSGAPKWYEEISNWYNTFNTGYIELAPGAELPAFENQLNAFVQKHFLPKRRDWRITLLPFSTEHSRVTDNEQLLFILSMVAVIIFSVSCINFINLTISQSLGRVREIGIRKVLGSKRSQLVLQFVVESVITGVIAVGLGLVIAQLAIPKVNYYFGFGISSDFMTNVDVYLLIGAVCLTASLFASAFPSGVLSSLKMIGALKGSLHSRLRDTYFRKGLMIVQFACSIFILLGSLIIWNQIKFMKNHSLSFDANNVVAMTLWEEMFKDLESVYPTLSMLQTELQKEPSILSASSSEKIPGTYNRNYNTFDAYAADSSDIQKIQLRQTWIDEHYFRTLDIELLKGEPFSKDQNNGGHVIINLSAMKALGWKDLDNKYVKSGGEGKRFQVVGVVEDYYYQSLKELIEPVIHFYEPLNNTLIVKLHPQKVSEGIRVLEKQWEDLDTYTSFNYYFLDDVLDQQYREQEKLATSATLFAIVALVIAGLGLFGSASFVVQSRRKEIGIRRTLGATVVKVILLFSNHFSWVIIIAIILSSAASYFVMGHFLNEFAYRITLSPWVFIAGGGAVLAGALLIVGMQSGKVAMENPVESLRDE